MAKIVAMVVKAVAIAACLAACGEISRDLPPADSAVPHDTAIPGDTGPPLDAPPTPRTYKGTLVPAPKVTFGGPAATPTVPPTVYCMYTITLNQLEVELAILPAGQVSAGRVQDLNVEAVIVSTTPNCPATMGVIPPNIASYTLQSARPDTAGMILTFRGAAANMPPATLTATLSPSGTGYRAVLSFHRTNAGDAVLNWTVPATVTLTPQ